MVAHPHRRRGQVVGVLRTAGGAYLADFLKSLVMSFQADDGAILVPGIKAILD